MDAMIPTIHIDTGLLHSLGVCVSEYNIFKKEWPQGCDVSLAVLQRANALGLQWKVVARQLLTAPATARLEEETAQAMARWAKETAPARGRRLEAEEEETAQALIRILAEWGPAALIARMWGEIKEVKNESSIRPYMRTLQSSNAPNG